MREGQSIPPLERNWRGCVISVDKSRRIDSKVGSRYVETRSCELSTIFTLLFAMDMVIGR